MHCYSFSVFKRKNDFFISDGNIQHTNNIISINFRVNAKFKINNIIKVYKLIDKNRVEIFQKKFNEEISNNKTIKLDFKTEKINSRWEKIYIEILELEKSKLNLIDQITLNLQNKFTFSDDQIIEKFNSCYYIK